MSRPARAHVEHFRVGSVGAQVRRQKRIVPRRLSRITAPAPSPKRIAVDAVVAVEDFRKRFGADQHDAAIDARAHERRSDGQSVDESAAGDLDIEGRLVFRAQLGPPHTSRRGKREIRRNGANDESIDVAGAEFRVFERHVAAANAKSLVASSGEAQCRRFIPVRVVIHSSDVSSHFSKSSLVTTWAGAWCPTPTIFTPRSEILAVIVTGVLVPDFYDLAPGVRSAVPHTKCGRFGWWHCGHSTVVTVVQLPVRRPAAARFTARCLPF